MKALIRTFNTLTGWTPGRVWVSGDMLLEMAAEIQTTVAHPSRDCHDVRRGPDGIHFGFTRDINEAIKSGRLARSREAGDPVALPMMDYMDYMDYEGVSDYPEILGMDTPSSYNPSTEPPHYSSEGEASELPPYDKSAITRLGDRFLKWHCVESASVEFRDRVKVHRMKLSRFGRWGFYARVPALLSDCVVEGSIQVEEVEWAEGSPVPARFGVSRPEGPGVKGLQLLKIECDAKAVPAAVMLRGRRKNVRDGGKYTEATAAEFLSNARFWSAPQRIT